jgi:hypothetical protein
VDSPPSTASTWPVMKSFSGARKNASADAICKHGHEKDSKWEVCDHGVGTAAEPGNSFLLLGPQRTPALAHCVSETQTAGSWSVDVNYFTLHFLHYRNDYITLHYITLHYSTLHYSTLQYITLHYITLHYITLHYITIHYITLHYITCSTQKKSPGTPFRTQQEAHRGHVTSAVSAGYASCCEVLDIAEHALSICDIRQTAADSTWKCPPPAQAQPAP